MHKHIILFDLDGTLCDTGLDLALSVNHSLEMLNLPVIDIELIKSYVGDGIHKLIERSLSHSDPEKFDECLVIFLEHYKEHCIDHTVPYPGCVNALKTLKEHHILGVLTNKDRSFSEIILKGLNIMDFFSEVVGGDTLNAKKPQPEGVFYFSEKYGISSEKIIMVGDHKTDLELCINAKIKSVFCNFGMGREGNFTPDFRIDSFDELSPLLNQILKN